MFRRLLDKSVMKKCGKHDRPTDAAPRSVYVFAATDILFGNIRPGHVTIVTNGPATVKFEIITMLSVFGVHRSLSCHSFVFLLL